MTEPFIGEIQIYGFNFAPFNWAFCNGATLPIQQNTALFALLGTQFGGNGQTTFQLPNFAGRAGCQQGNGPGLTPTTMGSTFGANSVTLLPNEMPAHSHGVNAFSQTQPGSGSGSPAAGSGLSFLTGNTAARTFATGPVDATLAPNMVQPHIGGGQPHTNQQPYLGMNFSIALQGIFPSFP